MSKVLPTALRRDQDVFNQPPPLQDYNVYETDRCLKEAVAREGGAWAEDKLQALGAQVGSARTIELARQANRFSPELRTHDRFGNRIDFVEFHPAWHELMTIGMAYEVHSLAWNEKRKGAHVGRAALAFLMNQGENGVCCPFAMTFASVPALRNQPEIAEEWVPRVCKTQYDPRPIPAKDKTAATIGMAMTERQGGSDVRANSTTAAPIGAGGSGGRWRLNGHKWFCSAPMSDAFLTLAQTGEGLSCFLVPRWLPNGRQNAIRLMRLKDKLGNRSNASAEIEYHDTTAWMIGEAGRGVATIIEMVHHTRLDASVSAAAIMRQAVTQAIHHAGHRSAFQRTLIDQPAMRAVLADLAVESEAATMLVLRLARAFDEQDDAFARMATALTKYWICKRTPELVFEAMECLGGGGYIEDSIMPRLYREAPVNSIWEGCGNVLCLDMLRAMERQPESLEAYFKEIDAARGSDKRFDAAADELRAALGDHDELEARARRLVERMALLLQGSLMLRHGAQEVAEAFCASRLGGGRGLVHGTLPKGLALREIIESAMLAG